MSVTATWIGNKSHNLGNQVFKRLTDIYFSFLSSEHGYQYTKYKKAQERTTRREELH